MTAAGGTRIAPMRSGPRIATCSEAPAVNRAVDAGCNLTDAVTAPGSTAAGRAMTDASIASPAESTTCAGAPATTRARLLTGTAAIIPHRIGALHREGGR